MIILMIEELKVVEVSGVPGKNYAIRNLQNISGLEISGWPEPRLPLFSCGSLGLLEKKLNFEPYI